MTEGKGYSIAELERLTRARIETVAQLARELLALKQAQEWIPVSERLPEESLIVLAWVVGDSQTDSSDFIPHISEMSYWENPRTKHLAWLWNGEVDVEYSVTHWRPLPAPPSPLPGGTK